LTVFDWTAKQFYDLVAATYFSLDLQKLCDSRGDEGEMCLPRELVNEIMRHNGNDLETLKRCSLTSRTFYSAARPLIHSRMALGVRSARLGWPRGLQSTLDTYTDQADVFNARYLSMAEERGLLRYGYVREVDIDLTTLARPENVLQLQQLRALETVHTLTIESLALHKVLPIFDSCFSHFVPTLQSLCLRATRYENVHQLMEFICRFPRLDDLELTDPLGPDDLGMVDAPPGTEKPRPQQPLPFRGHLVLQGNVSIVQSPLDHSGGIRFRSIEVGARQQDLAKLLVACSSTLELLRITCFDCGESGALPLTGQSTEASPATG
jgi:hypothetical protein